MAQATRQWQVAEWPLRSANSYVNPFADVALESEEVDIFAFIRMAPSLIRFRVYGEALRGEEPTILEFK